MSSFRELKQSAEKLRKGKQYTDALKIYSKLWISNRDQCDEWVGWGYAFCLKKLKDFDKALQVCREVYKIRADFQYNNDVYAWCIYYKEIKKNNISEELTFLRAAEGILKLSKQAKYSPYEVTVFKVLDYYNKKPIFPTNDILKWTAKLDPLILDDATFEGKTKDGKKKELASRKEKYYMLRIKALFNNGSYTECIKLSDFALSNFKKFHYDNDIWFQRHIANSNFMMGKLDIAVNQLKEILQKKKEWFIQKEIADVYFKKQDYKTSLKYAVAAAINIGKIENKIHLLELIVDILIKQQKLDFVKEHLALIYLIRKQNEWRISEELIILLKKYEVDIENIPNFAKVKKNIINCWNLLKYSNQTILFGYIFSIFPNGKSGFIKFDVDKSVYFSTKDLKSKKHQIQVNQKVSFYLEDTFDHKKKQKSFKAVKIEILRNIQALSNSGSNFFRVHEIAKALNINAKELMKTMIGLDIKVKSLMSIISVHDLERICNEYGIEFKNKKNPPITNQ